MVLCRCLHDHGWCDVGPGMVQVTKSGKIRALLEKINIIGEMCGSNVAATTFHI